MATSFVYVAMARAESSEQRQLTRSEMIDCARDWIAAWNRRDVQAVIKRFAGEASFRSPRASGLAWREELNGTDRIARYWNKSLANIEHLHFQLIDVICDEHAQRMAIVYSAEIDAPPQRACELFHFEHGLIVYGEALYG